MICFYLAGLQFDLAKIESYDLDEGGKNMALAVLLISLLIGMIWGGKIERLLNLNLRRLEIIFIALIIQYAVAFSSTLGLSTLMSYSGLLITGSYILLLIGLYFNRHIPSFWLIIIGTGFNAAVIITNGGRMPVSTNALSAAGLEQYIPLLEKGNHLKHILLTESTVLPWLADFIPMHKSYFPGGNVISPGDILIYLGMFLVVQRVMRRRKSRRGQARHTRSRKIGG
jgi:hypothetical protein